MTNLINAATDLLNQLTLLLCGDEKYLWKIGGRPLDDAYKALKHALGLPSRTQPTIVCLCGSTRFWRLFQQAGLRETMDGKIVLSIGAASGTDDEHFGNLPQAEYDRIKTMLDELHMRKIDLADEVLILDHEGYVGESTRRELVYAQKLGKHVRFWSRER